jgi:hypothetical protein
MLEPTDDQDMFRWLLQMEGCPYCGASIRSADSSCAACQRSLLLIYRPEQRSSLILSLVGVWGCGAGGAALIVVGAVAQQAGLLPREQPREQSFPFAAIAHLLGLPWNDTPVVAAPPPPWFIPALLIITLICALMACGCWLRRPWALYLGLGLSMIPLLVGIVAAVTLHGSIAIAPLITGILVSALLILVHSAATAQLRGEPRRIQMTPSASSAVGLFQDGRICQQQGMTYLAARHWARALGKDSSNPTYMYALALALVRLGRRESARLMVERALRIAPAHAELQALLAELTPAQPTTNPASS